MRPAWVATIVIACEDLGKLISTAKGIQASAPKGGVQWVTTTYTASETNPELEAQG